MTENRRIIVNVLATYGRSLFALICGLFSCRWVLMSLGKIDYGLFGVVGGLLAFVSFFNTLLSGAVGRFYAFSVGEAKKEGNEIVGLDNCRRWFNVAVFIHTLVPVFLLVVGYPIGIMAIKDFLNIPVDRMSSCIWVWRFACVGCFVGMVNIPYQAMYTAKQEIAELTIYSVCQTAFNFVFLYFMVTHPSDWLVKYSFMLCVVAVVPQVIITWRAFVKYQECRIVLRYLWDKSRLMELLRYAGSRFFCSLSIMYSNQGVVILVNKFLGPECNAAMNIGTTVSNHATTLSASCSNAFWPAITNAVGEGRFDYMRTLVFRTCFYSMLSVLIFAVPLIAEIDEIMVLWLKNPPAESAGLCVCLLISAVVDRMTDGHWMAILAKGKILAFQIAESICWFSLAFAVAVSLYFGGSLICIGCCFALIRFAVCGVKLYYGKSCVGLTKLDWVRKTLFPFCIVALSATGCALLPRLTMPESFVRVVVTSACSTVGFMLSLWMFVLTKEEKENALLKLTALRNRFVLCVSSGEKDV